MKTILKIRSKSFAYKPMIKFLGKRGSKGAKAAEETVYGAPKLHLVRTKFSEAEINTINNGGPEEIEDFANIKL